MWVVSILTNIDHNKAYLNKKINQKCKGCRNILFTIHMFCPIIDKHSLLFFSFQLLYIIIGLVFYYRDLLSGPLGFSKRLLIFFLCFYLNNNTFVCVQIIFVETFVAHFVYTSMTRTKIIIQLNSMKTLPSSQQGSSTHKHN